MNRMAKMNNNGWGVGTLIGFIIVFVLFIIVISVLIYNIDHEKGSEIHLVEENLIIFNHSK